MVVGRHRTGSFPHPLAMETAEHVEGGVVPSAGRRAVLSLDWGGIATWLLAAVLVVYLALENGASAPFPRARVGIGVGWVLLLGVPSRALPLPGRPGASLAVIG